LPDVHYGDEEHFVDADRKTGISRWTLTGTTGDFYSFRDGKVICRDSTGKLLSE
jgi:hypothetical protein